MPVNLPSSFASAAAGQSRGPRPSRDSGGSGDWVRRDGRPTNGTLTFRRSSTTPFNQNQPTSESALQSGPAEAAPGQSMTSFPSEKSGQYSKDQMLDIYKGMELDPDRAHLPHVETLYMDGWNPEHVNDSGRSGWGKNEGYVPQDPGVCWDSSGHVRPMGLQDLSSEEKELFSSDVNSPIKQLQQKDGGQGGGGVNGRKASISHGSNFGMSSPSTASRPGTRRRETIETNPFPSAGLTSPTATGRFSDSSWFPRKSLDAKEPGYDEEEDTNHQVATKPTGFGLARTNTSGSTGFGGASSLWGASGTTPTTTAAGMGGFGNFSLASSTGDKRFGSTRGESKLAHLIPKESSESIGPKASEPQNLEGRGSWRPRQRTGTDPFGTDHGFPGAGNQDADASQSQLSRLMPGHPYDTPMKSSPGAFGISSLGLGDEDISGSPETNPYRSPPAEHGDEDQGQGGPEKMHHIGAGTGDAPIYGTLPRGFAPNPTLDAGDRSQTSSGGAKGFPGLNSLGGWPTSLNTSTPDREQVGFGNAFGSSIFSPVGDLQSPSFGGVSGVFAPPSMASAGQSGSLRGASKMGSLFPAAMQAQMQQSQEPEAMDGSIPDLRQINPLGAIGRGAIRPPETYDDLMTNSFGTSDAPPSPRLAPMPSQVFDGAQSRNETPPNQPLSMVMPDRMRWVYLDPQGDIQGPFTGLEMNDWYKANFFTPDLRVKKQESSEFEPLGQLIRRIGNSREPFLVPQMGIPHGQPSLTGAFSQGDRGVVIPPLVGAFPSFGRTLTAEEQNNLERRKQEEQFLMARQREAMAAQHHQFSKIQMSGGVPSALHHHSSAHSLQSQPSFGSMTSPLGAAPPIGAIGPTSSFFDPASAMSMPAVQSGIQPGSDFPPDLTVEERRVLAGISTQPSNTAGTFLSQAAGAAPYGDASQRPHLPGADQLQKDSQGFSERLKEFQEIRAQREAEDTARSSMAAVAEEAAEELAALVPHHAQAEAARIIEEVAQTSHGEAMRLTGFVRELSLTQQVQRAQAAAAADPRVQTEDPWIKPPSGLPMPFPPPQSQSTTPLPAPTAQRTRSTLPDQYASRSQSETPESTTAGAAQAPPAPWAREQGDGRRGPSLKDIQEAEAKKAAKAEEAAAFARRAAAEQDAVMLREREKAGTALAPGLPTTSTWGSASPVTATANSAWTKPGPVRGAPGLTPGPATHGNGRKSIADIQREEEVRKQRAQNNVAQSGSNSGPSMGKRYADLASKGQAPAGPSHAAAPTAGPSGGAGWATVGAGGKVKIPTGPAANRSASSGNVKPVPPPAARPAIKQSASAIGKADTGGAAMDEFKKWLHRELGRGISAGIDVSSMASSLMELPLDQTIISEAVYGNSTTMDGRHFAEEFVRRKKLADKGVVEKQPANPPSTSDNKLGGGWSEVAKKGGNNPKEDSTPAGFKVVPARKKGKK